MENWTVAKQKITSVYKKMGKTQADYTKEASYDLQKEFKELKEIESLNIESVRKRLVEIETKLKQMQITKIEGAALRAKVKYLQNVDRGNNAFFLSLEKSRKTSNLTKILDINNVETSSMNDTLLEVHRFYYELWTESNVPTVKVHQEKEETIFSTDLKLPKRLNGEDEVDLCATITDEEVRLAILKAEVEKSPGPDGLTYEFYKRYINQITPILTRIFNSFLNGKDLPESFKLSYVSLIPKAGDTSSLKNWRPISLVNTDYKIYSKILADRCYSVADKVISNHQYAKPKSSTHLAIRKFLDTLHFSNRCKTDEIMIFLDQEKAFDRVNRTHIKRCLKRLGFPNSFVTAIVNTLKGSSAQILVNGHLTNTIYTTRGVRQGDPLSPFLYTIALEPLLYATENLEGSHPTSDRHKPETSLAYADDALFFCRNITDANLLSWKIELFQMASGAKINTSKSFAISNNGKINLNELKGTLDNLPLLSRDEHFKHLGITVNQKGDISQHWKNILNKFTNVIEKWKTRNLSLQGKVAILNNLAYPQLIYSLCVIECSEDIFHKVDQITREFVWKGANLIALDTLRLPRKLGGLGLMDLRKIASKQMNKWKDRISKDKTSWKRKLNKLAIIDLNTPLNAALEKKRVKNFSSNFWTQVIKVTKKPTKELNQAKDRWGDWKWNSKINNFISPKHFSTLFLFKHKALPMAERFQASSTCCMCGNSVETHEHLITCSYTQERWHDISPSKLLATLKEVWKKPKKDPTSSIMATAFLHSIWRYRCSLNHTPITFKKCWNEAWSHGKASSRF